MTRSLVSTAFGFAASLLLSASAFAQAGPRTPNDAAEKPAVSADSTAWRARSAARPSVTYAAFNATMGTLPSQSARFVANRGLRAEQIALVDVRNLFRSGDEQKQYEQALEQYARQIEAMRSTLQKSALLGDLLKDRGLKLSHVIGVQTTPDGGAIVFYQPE
jgi:hypothetical protein